MKASDFEAIYQPDGTCTFWGCHGQGVILAYDDFSPEVAHWFCQECWEEGEFEVMMVIIEDKREKRGKEC